MYSLFKSLHLIGMGMFLGSILVHITAGLIPGAASDPVTMSFARQTIDIATRFVTLPGLALAIASGAIMAWRRHPRSPRDRWLAAHQIAAVVIVAITVMVMIPTGHRLLAATTALSVDSAVPDALTDLANREAAFGAVNLVLLLAAIGLGVVKPGLGRKPSIP